MRLTVTRGVLVGGALLGAVVLAGCSSGASTGSSATTTTRAPASTSSTSADASAAACTKSAILAAAQAATNLGSVQSVSNVGCAGSWAYANVTEGSGSAGVDAVIVLQAQGSHWVVADRAGACNGHLVPASIYTPACTTS